MDYLRHAEEGLRDLSSYPDSSAGKSDHIAVVQIVATLAVAKELNNIAVLIADKKGNTNV